MFVHREDVRFRDLDPMGHVNNAVFLTYIESARAAYFWNLGIARSLEDLTLVVARVEIDFRAPVGFPEVVEVGVRAGRFGEKSFGLDHELHVRGELVAEAKTVLVAYDYARAQTVEIPADWREKLAA
jgi:acyl-CoA thioester hydrolase